MVAALATGLSLLAAAGRAPASDGHLVLIVSREWRGPDAVAIPMLRKLYLGRRSRLQGHRIQCFDLPPGHPVRQGFVRSVLQMSDAELEEYWIEQALTGGALPPREVGSVEEMVAAVARGRWALGYLDPDAFRKLGPSRVRVLGVMVEGRPLRPGDDGYPIRSRARGATQEETEAGSAGRATGELEPPPASFIGPSSSSATYGAWARSVRGRESRGAGSCPGRRGQRVARETDGTTSGPGASRAGQDEIT